MWFKVEKIASDYFANGEPALEAGEVMMIVLHTKQFLYQHSMPFHQPVAPSSARSCDSSSSHGGTDLHQNSFQSRQALRSKNIGKLPCSKISCEYSYC